MIFSTDAAVSFSICLFCILIFVFAQNNYAQETKTNINNFELEEKALMVADSLVKNYDPNNTLLGSCVLDTDKKRVLTNQISMENLRKAKPINFGEIFVKNISYKSGQNKELITISNKKAQECVSSKRFVLVDGEKSILEVLTCRGENQ